MAEMDRRTGYSGSWIIMALAAVVLIGLAFLFLAPRDETADNAGEATTQQDGPAATPADRPRDQTDNKNP
jgi:hypothetical protein